MRYGQWQEATDLAVEMFDAILGRISREKFDQSIQKISAYDPVEPVLPFNDINILVNELLVRSRKPQEQGQISPHNLGLLHKTLKERAGFFCDRVLECSAERQRLYSPNE